MKITKEEISPVDVRLTVAIEENDYKDDVTKKLKELGRTFQRCPYGLRSIKVQN